MTMMVSKYKIEIKEEPGFAGETFEERYARVTASRESLTTTQVKSIISYASISLNPLLGLNVYHWCLREDKLSVLAPWLSFLSSPNSHLRAT